MSAISSVKVTCNGGTIPAVHFRSIVMNSELKSRDDAVLTLEHSSHALNNYKIGFGVEITAGDKWLFRGKIVSIVPHFAPSGNPHVELRCMADQATADPAVPGPRQQANRILDQAIKNMTVRLHPIMIPGGPPVQRAIVTATLAASGDPYRVGQWVSVKVPNMPSLVEGNIHSIHREYVPHKPAEWTLTLWGVMP